MSNESQNPKTPVSRALSALKIPHREFAHPGPIHSLEQAAEERGQRPEQVVRSILFRLAKGQYAMVLMAGPQQISWPALREYFSQSRLTMANRSEVLQATGYELGAVSPFGLPAPIPVLIDEAVFSEVELSIGSGVRGTTIILKSADLQQALPEAVIGHFSG